MTGLDIQNLKIEDLAPVSVDEYEKGLRADKEKNIALIERDKIRDINVKFKSDRGKAAHDYYMAEKKKLCDLHIGYLEAL